MLGACRGPDGVKCWYQRGQYERPDTRRHQKAHACCAERYSREFLRAGTVGYRRRVSAYARQSIKNTKHHRKVFTITESRRGVCASFGLQRQVPKYKPMLRCVGSDSFAPFGDNVASGKCKRRNLTLETDPAGFLVRIPASSGGGCAFVGTAAAANADVQLVP